MMWSPFQKPPLKNCVENTLVEKSQRHSSRLARQVLYIENHAWQIYKLLWGIGVDLLACVIKNCIRSVVAENHVDVIVRLLNNYSISDTEREMI